MLKIKVCGMTDPGNIQQIAALMPDFMGFIFYSHSKRYVGNSPPESLCNDIPPGIIKTGVFVNTQPSEIIDTMKRYKLDMAQLHGNEPVSECERLKNNNVALSKAFGIDNKFDFSVLRDYSDLCDYFLFDTGTTAHGGSGKKFDWRKIYEYKNEKQFFLSGGIGPEDISIIKNMRLEYLFAVDINSRFEISPGLKDIDEVKEFIEELRR